jgi:hypothetical protein
MTAVVQQLLTDARVPGLSMAVIGDRQALTVVGVRNAIDQTAVDQQTIFGAASLSKPLFAYAVLQLVDAGKLALHTPLSLHVPDYVADDPRAAAVTGDNLPAFIAHNNEISRIDPQQLKEQEDAWKSHDEQGQVRPSPVALDEARFMGELASAYFIPKVDMPFRFEELPELKGRNPGELKAEYMRFYRAHTVDDVIKDDPKSGIADFPLQYLQLTMHNRDLYNGAIVGFWNVTAKSIWKRHGQGVLDALTAVKDSKPGDDETAAQAVYETRVKALRKELDSAFALIEAGLSKIEDEKREVSKVLNSHPALLARHARIAHTLRTAQDYNWLITYRKFLDELDNVGDLRKPDKPVRITPPFALPKSILPQSD